jgi:MOSC domain-containing protein YiiM
VIVSVSASAHHRFSKPALTQIRLIQDWGVEGDAHGGPFVQHRYLARWRRNLPNERQVHLIAAELFEQLEPAGFVVGPGQLGENITTRHISLESLPAGTQMKLGGQAVIELRGLRTPCVLIERFQKGLLRMVVQKKNQPPYSAGVMAVVLEGGDVRPGDPIEVLLPSRPWRALPAT